MGWASTAHYVTTVAEDGDFQLRSEAGAPTRYFIRRRGADRLELTQADDDAEHPLLFVADTAVLERHLIGLFADDIREDLDLPLLEMDWSVDALAEGYEVSAMVRGYRTLKRVGGGPVAAAPDPTLSLLALVPLSHYLQWSISELKRSFLNPAGVPLLRGGRYASH
ncbi:Imm61 family immunity protein [Mycobacterium sp. 4D054]|uniref:Imm61 family immunity protein n=1 Tax=Mycobacterium sp. 4D054 TaxID=3457440 RepID=UPI003FD0CEDD